MIKKLAIKKITDCRITLANKFRTRLVFKHDTILTKEESVLRKIISLFEGQNIQTQCKVLSCRIDFYSYVYKLAIKFHENGHEDRNIDDQISKKTIEQKLGCTFIRTDPGKEDFDVFKIVSEIFRHIKQTTKKPLISKTSKRFLKLKIK